jgi:cytoskeletal protein CcmA (bactofilin family)
MVADEGSVDHRGQSDTYLGKNSHITGKLRCAGTIRIDGHVEGEIAARESVLIAEGAVVQAQITADSVVITGSVTGNITARRRVEIREPGKMYGDLTTPSLIIHAGVVFEGYCSMGGANAQKVDGRLAQPSTDGREQRDGNSGATK